MMMRSAPPDPLRMSPEPRVILKYNRTLIEEDMIQELLFYNKKKNKETRMTRSISLGNDIINFCLNKH